jgi:hypothetical protein
MAASIHGWPVRASLHADRSLSSSFQGICQVFKSHQFHQSSMGQDLSSIKSYQFYHAKMSTRWIFTSWWLKKDLNENILSQIPHSFRKNLPNFFSKLFFWEKNFGLSFLFGGQFFASFLETCNCQLMLNLSWDAR